ncbi:MAG: hypothetical protein LC740_06095 [Actinobacteria bacterium]|nr:hypothetical protein [Actinomycetota bacterium]
MAEQKFYEVHDFEFEFTPKGDPFKGLMVSSFPELEPYAAELTLSNPRSCDEYAKRVSELCAMSRQGLKVALNSLCSLRHEEVTAAREAEREPGSDGVPPGADEEEGGEPPTVPYRETPHGLVWDKPTRDGTTPTPLTNFTARITADVAEDDGVEVNRQFQIEARLHDRRATFSVPAERFAAMGWPLEHLGAGAILYPGSGTKDHARAAVQMLSGEIEERRVFAHTGWRKAEGGWMYLHAGGAIGPLGPLTEVEVSEASLRFLELAPLRLTALLLAAIYRAPLSEVVPVDLSVYIAGPTGAQKTELTAIAQAHYGYAFNGRHLPANWSSTENALERLAFAAKDAVLTVDDFAPTGTTYDVARLHRVADRFLRSVGNRAGRGRMRADTSLRAEYYPRGLVLSSGEDVPRGQSLRARMMVGEVSPGAVNLDILTELQKVAAEGLLASAMSGYLQYLASRMENLKGKLPARQRKLRTSATGGGAHARTPDIVASLALGWEEFLKFAMEAGAITKARGHELRDEGWTALQTAAAAQAEHQAGEEPTQQFGEVEAWRVRVGRPLRQMVSAGQVHRLVRRGQFGAARARRRVRRSAADGARAGYQLVYRAAHTLEAPGGEGPAGLAGYGPGSQHHSRDHRRGAQDGGPPDRGGPGFKRPELLMGVSFVDE